MIIENCKITKLDNGIRVISEYIPHVKSFSLGFWFSVGSVVENKKNNGITHFIEHMVFKGTENRTAKKISDDIESLGGYLNAFTSKEQTCFYGRGLSQHIEKTFEVIADMIQNPRFSEKDIVNEAGVVVDELYDIEDSPEELIFDKLESIIYRGHPFELPIIGTEKNIRGFTKDQLFAFVNRFYRNNNLDIVASGNIKHEVLVEYAHKYLRNTRRSSPQQRKKMSVKRGEKIFIEKDIQQTHVIMGFPAPGFKSKKRVGSAILSHILGEGSSSRLFQKLREKNGIAYQINSFLNSFYDVSTLGIYFSTSLNQIPKSISIIQSEIEKIKEKPVGLRELKRAREYIKGSLLMSLESTTNRMLRMGNSMLYHDRIKSVEESIREVELISPEDIQNEAVLRLNMGKMHTVAISPNKDIKAHF